MRRAQLIGLAVIVVASGLWVTPAAGQEFGMGGVLLRQCAEALKTSGDPTKDLQDSALCEAYVTGIGDISSLPDTPFYRRLCPTSESTVDQAVRSVYNWLEDHPEALEVIAGISVVAALQEAWPCSP